MFTSCNWETFI